MKILKTLIALAACFVLGMLIYNLAGGSKPGQQPESEPEAIAEETQKEAIGQEAAHTPVEAENDTESKVSQTDGAIGEKLHEILLSAVEYYNDTVNSTTIISQNGRLYNAAADTVITAEYLLEREYLSRDYMVDGAAVLYVFPEDFAEIAPDYEDFSDDLKVYVAASLEDGYLIDSKGVPEQIRISTEDFGKLLFRYRSDYGEIRRVTGSTGDYPEIVAAIKEFQKTDGDFYVRYGMRDDKYAVMIVSPKSGYEAIYEYVLVYENDKWKVRIPNLEEVTKAKVVVNNVCPDLNVLLMPDYDLKSYQGKMRSGFEGVTEALKRDGYITEDEPVIEYISSTDQFMFIKYENGQMFLGTNNDNVWVLGEVTAPENALGRFKSIDDRAPDFVIIWE